MIDITVKTLDSQNHAFSVEDDITVAQFKVRIADTVNIPADTQRIIYCGRVLQDEVKLSDYDVNGKVVHLVQRAPPSSVQNQTPRSSSPQTHTGRRYRGLEHGNAMYLGSMAFPSNLMESQGIVPPPPTHSLAASRLNVARRMLKRAEAAIRILENPQSRPAEQTPPEEPQEEVTPVFEARVIVPNTNEPIDEALVLSAVENSILNAAGTVSATEEAAGASVPETITVENNGEEAAREADIIIESDSPTASTPEEAEQPSSSAENASQSSSQTSSRNIAENASRTSEMADLLTLLGQLQVRFAPFLERYQNFMREDPVVLDEDLRATQTMMNRVSEVLHFFGHAYHSLSDIILKVRSPPPRALLCRPILIQHSALVQTGFPIQVEAQINFGSDRPNDSAGRPPTTEATTSPPEANAPSAENTSSAPPTTTTSTNQPQQQPRVPPIPPMFGGPFRPGASMHIQSFPIEIRGISHMHPRASGGPPSASPTQLPAESETAAPDGNTAGPNATAPNVGAQTGPGNQQWIDFNNPNMEFFMEVMPESITIDSLETTLVGPNQANEVLRGSMNRTTPEIIQSIMQMAGQLMNDSQPQQQQTPTSTSEPSAPPQETPSQTQSAASSNNQNGASVPGQNSQARGNTQTNPTTATHTRSTSRPHVHLAQHAMQGFDPFLPCNSHHVTSRRRIHFQNQQATAQQAGQNRAAQQNAQANVNPQNPLQSIVQAVLHSFRNAYYTQRFEGGVPQPAGANNGTRTNTTGTNTASSAQAGDNAARSPPFPNFLSHLQNMNLSDLNRQGPTVAELLEPLFPGVLQAEGANVFTDLFIFLMRHLTVEDIHSVMNSRLGPLMRIRNELRNFFIRRVLDGCTTTASVDRGVNRLIAEMQPIFENNLAYLEVRDDIDIVRSAQMLFWARLPNIINLAISRSPNSLRMLVDQCRITARQFCALIIRSSTTEEAAVDQIFNIVMHNMREEQLGRLFSWSSASMRSEVQSFISNLSVPESILQPYIVRRADAVLPSVVDVIENNIDVAGNGNTAEAMEVNSDTASGSGSETIVPSPISLENDTEPLPAVVLGSEVWHNQVPADWVPIIARDSQRQRRQNPQPPFSDAYLSGMPSKRRKIVASAKPQGSLPQVISESVRRAVTATGLSSSAPLETVAQAAGNDLNVQAAYRDLLRSSVQSTLQNNEDFTPDRFPNASNYFNKQ